MSMQNSNKKIISNCDDCLFYDYDDETGEYSCHMSLDEDEMVRYMSGKTRECHYYRKYDEYKSVQRQN